MRQNDGNLLIVYYYTMLLWMEQVSNLVSLVIPSFASVWYSYAGYTCSYTCRPNFSVTDQQLNLLAYDFSILIYVIDLYSVFKRKISDTNKIKVLVYTQDISTGNAKSYYKK